MSPRVGNKQSNEWLMLSEAHRKKKSQHTEINYNRNREPCSVATSQMDEPPITPSVREHHFLVDWLSRGSPVLLVTGSIPSAGKTGLIFCSITCCGHMGV